VPNVTPLRAEDPDHIDRYRLAGRISGLPGAGPFYLTTGPDATELAIRLLRGPWTRDAAARDRFTAEAGSARRVPPFCAARIMDFGADEDYAYLVSEYVGGRSLLDVVAGRGRLRGLDLEALALGSSTGLAAVHQAGLVHGSFGPEYVIMAPAGPRIIEFGITPPYGQATPAADMLAWAQTIVFASMGRPPATLSDLDALPGLLREIVADCLSGDPGFRPEARAVVLDLLGDSAPDAGALAEGSRRAAQLTEAAQRAAAQREAQQAARAARTAPGGRTGRHPGADDRARPARGRDGDDDRDYDDGDDQRGPRRPDGSRRRFPVVPVAAGLVVTLAVVFLLIHLAGGGPSPAPPAAGNPADSTSPVSSTDSAAPSPTPSVPAGLAGTWQGQVQAPGPGGVVLDVKISLTGGPAGPDTIAYSSAGTLVCSGELTPQAVPSGGSVTLSQGIIIGQKKCGNGTVALASAGTGMSFTFRGQGAGATTGTLARS
jgi:eukaryotic-like serine/threonine-protein kinase